MSSFSVPMELPNLNAALRDCAGGSAEARWVAAMALGREDGEGVGKALDALLALIDDPVAEVRAQAIESLAEQIRSSATVETKSLNRVFDDESDAVRCAAVSNAAALSGDPSSVAMAALADVSGSVRATAARVLGEMTATDRADSLVALLDDPVEFVSGQAAISLGLMGREEGTRVLEELLSSGEQDAVDAAVALGTIGGQAAAGALRQRHGSWRCPVALKGMTAAAMLRCGDEAGGESLRKLLSSSRDSNVMAAVQAVFMLPSPLLIPDLETLAKGNDSLRSSCAVQAIGEIGRVAPEPVLASLKNLRSQVGEEVACEIDDVLAGIGGV